MKAKATAIGILFTALAWTGANAAVISHNDITGTNPGLQNPYTTGITSDYSDDITASGIGRVGLTGKTADDRYNASGWSTGALDTGKYFTFTLDAKDGYAINFSSFEYRAQRSNTGPTSFAFRSSIDGFTTNIGSPTATGATIDLTAPQFQHLTNPIEFRLYGYDSGSGNGTFSVNDYTFNGTVEAVPEPGTLALVGVGSLLMLGHARDIMA